MIYLQDIITTKRELLSRETYSRNPINYSAYFWASLEHKIYYKFEGHAPAYISHDLQECSKIVSELDEKMLMLNEAILKAKEEQEKKEAEEK